MDMNRKRFIIYAITLALVFGMAGIAAAASQDKYGLPEPYLALEKAYLTECPELQGLMDIMICTTVAQLKAPEADILHNRVCSALAYGTTQRGWPGAHQLVALLPGGPGGMPGVLATIGPVSDQALTERQLDVGFALVLVTMLGIMAAIVSARAAARALSRPVADLRDAALAFGMGLEVPPPRRRPPTEIAPVFDAFGRMAAGVRAGQAALEDARRRTEQVLATVSTGVVALDRDGRVLLAIGQAEDIFGVALPRGAVQALDAQGCHVMYRPIQPARLFSLLNQALSGKD